jgi:tryptophanyl-tRNA synthetase
MGLTKPTKSQIPQSRLNKAAKLSKNLLRIVAFGFLAYYEIQAAAVLLILAELIAIGEQQV